MTHEETAAKLARIEAMLETLLKEREFDASPFVAGDKKAAAFVGMSHRTFLRWAVKVNVRPKTVRGMRIKSWDKHELTKALKSSR